MAERDASGRRELFTGPAGIEAQDEPPADRAARIAVAREVCASYHAAPVHLTSFGYGHGQPPADAHVVVDVRGHFKDPHVNPRLRQLTGYDGAVMSAVMGTAGIPELVDAIVAAARAFRLGPQPGPVRIVVGCAGGRHRSAAVVMQVAERLRNDDIPAYVRHRDIGRPVIARRSAGAR